MLSRQLTIVVLCFLTQAVISRVVPLPEGFRLKPSQNSTCPCADPRLCKPVQKIHAKEIFGFGGTDWQNFDWDVVTTIAWASDPELVCHAHAKNTRIIAGAPHDMPLTSNKTARAEYIQAAIDMVRDQHLDGITFDYESPINKTAPERDYYTQIVSEATAAFHEQLPGTQVSVCVGWSPNDIDGRDYDYVGLAKGSDLFYVMVYDTRSQIFDRCIASANAPAARANRGLFGYLDLGIPPQQLIMGLPWYGYDYKCPDPSMSAASPYCAIPEIPFRGVNCSDAAGKEYSFAHFREIMSSPNATTPRLWDNSVESPFFNYRSSDGSIHQVWYDDAESLSIKYRLAKAMNLRGVGPYTFTDLDYSTPEARKDAASMWQALRAFLD